MHKILNILHIFLCIFAVIAVEEKEGGQKVVGQKSRAAMPLLLYFLLNSIRPTNPLPRRRMVLGSGMGGRDGFCRSVITDKVPVNLTSIN